MKWRSTTYSAAPAGQTYVLLKIIYSRYATGVTQLREVVNTRIFKGKLQVESREGKIVWRDAEWRECWSCGKQFLYPLHYDIKAAREQRRSVGRYCSLACSGKANHKRYGRQRRNKRCEVCGELFEVNNAQYKRHRTCGKPYCKHRMKVISGREKWERRQKEMVDNIVARKEARENQD